MQTPVIPIKLPSHRPCLTYWGSGFAEGRDSPYMEALLTSQREAEERTVHPVRQFYDIFTRVSTAEPAAGTYIVRTQAGHFGACWHLQHVTPVLCLPFVAHGARD